MPQYYDDYRWKGGRPVGIGQMDGPMEGKPCFKFIPRDDGIRIEQFDSQGRFLRLVSDPNDFKFQPKDYKDTGDGSFRIRFDDQGAVCTFEKYTFLDANRFLVKAEIYNADGRLLEIHEPSPTSTVFQHIVVKDALGKPRMILHHSKIDKGRANKITEEYVL